MKEVFVN